MISQEIQILPLRARLPANLDPALHPLLPGSNPGRVLRPVQVRGAQGTRCDASFSYEELVPGAQIWGLLTREKLHLERAGGCSVSTHWED